MLSDFLGDEITVKVVKSSEESRHAKRLLLRRAKVSERDFARWLIKHDGPDTTHPPSMTTSTGRIGHVTGIQADALSNHYLGESKHIVVPIAWLRFWDKISAKAVEWGKDPILHFNPSNTRGKTYPNWHWISVERHSELLQKEKAYDNAGH